MLKIENVFKTFNAGTINEKVALNGVNLTLNEGDFVTVIGGNGAGKSTFLKILYIIFMQNYLIMKLADLKNHILIL